MALFARSWRVMHVPAGREAQYSTSNHALLQRRLRSPLPVVAFEGVVDAASGGYARDHRIRGDQLVAGSMYFEMALFAASEVLGTRKLVLEDVQLGRPLLIPSGQARRV